MLIKSASLNFTEINTIHVDDFLHFAKNSSLGNFRIASANLKGNEKQKIIAEEIKKHPNALFFRAKAIEADQPNNNGDYFSWEELINSYKTFEGVPFFTNHDNQNVENAKGKVIFAEAVPEEKAIYTICFIDRDAYPHICRSIEEEYVTGVSMGCSVEHSICNICGNKAERTEDYCTHIKNRKGRKFTGKSRNVNTGEEKSFNNHPVFEYNYGLKFIELSAVVDPACPNCHIDTIISKENYLSKVASIENELRMIRSSAIEKKASQQEIEQIEGVLSTLEQIAISLINNRKQVEMEFSSDLVKIMSDLQSWLEELVGAGYASINPPIPGTFNQNVDASSDHFSQAPQAPQSTISPSDNDNQSNKAFVSPVSMETNVEDIGSISGSADEPLIKGPKLPIQAPIAPKLSFSNSSNVHQSSDVNNKSFENINCNTNVITQLNNLVKKIDNLGDENMGTRRTSMTKKLQKEKTMEILSSSWQEKLSFVDYVKKIPNIENKDCKLFVNFDNDSFVIVIENKHDDNKIFIRYEDLDKHQLQDIMSNPEKASVKMLDVYSENFKTQKEGVKRMETFNQKSNDTGLRKASLTVQENQLDNKDIYHPRTEVGIHDVTQKQLESKRSGEEDVITESQLNNKKVKLNPRKTTPSVITEGQFDSDNRLQIDEHSVTEEQLSDYRFGEQNQTTEGQLNNSTSPWHRASSSKVSIKNAAEHMSAVVEAMALTSIKTGCTPEEICIASSKLIDGLENRYNLYVSLTEKSSNKEDVNYAKRLAYWQNKNLKVANAGIKEITDSFVDDLRRMASNGDYNIDLIIDAIDVATESSAGVDSISAAIEDKLKIESSVTASHNRKDELRSALINYSNTQLNANVVEENVIESKDSLEVLNKAALKNADTIIQTSFEEMGVELSDSNIKQEIVSFAKGALASKSLRLAAITNVTISGDTIQIAVETDTEKNEVNIDAGEGKTEIPIGTNNSFSPSNYTPEGDATGEGIGSLTNAKSFAKKNKYQIHKEAQSPIGGGMMAPGGSSATGAPEQSLTGNPSGDAVQALTTGLSEEENKVEIPTTGERQMPWTICPECGSSDVDVEVKDDGTIIGRCNACGAVYEAMVKKNIEFKIIKPSGSESFSSNVEKPEAPEVPSMPVAAQTIVNKSSLKRIASNQKKHGHVCPACGNKNCKASKNKNGSVKFVCANCGTGVKKDMLISQKDPSKSMMRVEWSIFPEVTGCRSCIDKASSFASQIKMASLLREASGNSKKFPMSACIERLAKKYGGDSVASFGPCKGQLLAKCVCEELQVLGLRKIRHMNKLASVSMESDPYDQCMQDQIENENYSTKQAEAICNCIKKRFASENDDNIYLHAFAEDIKSGVEKDLNIQDLLSLNTLRLAQKKRLAKEAFLKKQSLEDMDIESSILSDDEVKEASSSSRKNITIKSLKKSMDTSKPKLVDSVEDDVVAGVPRSQKAIGNESKDNIDVEPAELNIPRGNAEMGNESKDNINPPAVLPDVPVDNSYMGIEKELQKDMPEINNKIKGTVIADSVELTIKNNEIQHIAKNMKLVDSVEEDVVSGVPRSDKPIGNESEDNIDVKPSELNVPRGNAEMGNESKENINPPAEDLDVPMNDAYMGVEKEIQKDMPELNDKMLKQVQQKRQTQLDRIAGARKNEAVKVAAWLTANQRIANTQEAFDTVVKSLVGFEIDQIKNIAEIMFPKNSNVKQASTDVNKNVQAGYSIPAIVQESSSVSSSQDTSEALKNKLINAFTIGNNKFDKDLTLYGVK